jgi:hypothetical protein
MHCEPYEAKSIRVASLWDEITSLLGLHPAVVRRGQRERWRCGVSTLELLGLIKKGKITVRDFDGISLTKEQAEAEETSYREVIIEEDFSDLVLYRAKQLIEVGDETVANKTKTFTFTGTQYITQGKRYKILSLFDRGGSNFGFTTETDIPNEVNYESGYGLKVLWRDHKEIWNWHLAYLALFMEQNPNHPDTDEMKSFCDVQAEGARLGVC